jgi:uncharacterized protein YbjQ (UPF0145 family)
MLVSKSNKIPDKEITAILGPVSVKVYESVKWAREKFAIELLEKKVKARGGNAIINLTVRRVGLDMKDTYSGVVAVVEDIRPFWETVYCRQCGKSNKRYYSYCMHCGEKQ